MYVVTGGAGFIASNIVSHLSDSGEEVVVCDWMKDDERWRVVDRRIARMLITWLESGIAKYVRGYLSCQDPYR